MKHQTTANRDMITFQHCGQNVPSPNMFTSTGNQMYVRMKADGSVAAKGFIANYTWVRN